MREGKWTAPWTIESAQERLNAIPYENFMAEYQGTFPVADASPLSLVCERCGRGHGDNNALITDGPHRGARPTDLTVYCEVSGRQERVVLMPPRRTTATVGYLTETLPVRCSKCGARQLLERKGKVCGSMQQGGSRCDGVIR